MDAAQVPRRLESAHGLSTPQLRRLAREIGRDHNLARRLWATGIHDARVLAVLVEQPERVTERQAERWVRAVDSWGICDQPRGDPDRRAIAGRDSRGARWTPRTRSGS